jgi:hypothetical protein
MKLGLVLCLLLGAVSPGRAETVNLLDGRLKLDTGEAFFQEEEAKAEKKSELAHFAARDSDGWGAITRGTHGLRPDGLATYLKNKVAEYTKGLSWLPRAPVVKERDRHHQRPAMGRHPLHCSPGPSRPIRAMDYSTLASSLPLTRASCSRFFSPATPTRTRL